MRLAMLAIAVLTPAISSAQSDTWSLEVLEQYAAWIREAGFDCSTATRVTEAGSGLQGKSFKVVCGTAGTPATTDEAMFRLTLRPNGTPLVVPWQE